MKKYITIIALLTTLSVVAEGYIPTYVAGREWTYKYVNGEYYKILAIPNEEYFDLCEEHHIDSYREIGDKVIMNILNHGITDNYAMQNLGRYATMYNDSNVVMFDYNLQIGDTLSVFEGYVSYSTGYSSEIRFDGKIIKLESIDEVVINGISRKRYNFEAKRITWIVEKEIPNPGEYQYYEMLYNSEDTAFKYKDSWIEGIGYTYMAQYGIHGDESKLISVKDNGVEIYAGLGSTPPAIEKSQQITRNGNCLTCDGELVAYDATGRRVAQGATIDLATLPRGIYVVHATLRNGATESIKVVW